MNAWARPPNQHQHDDFFFVLFFVFLMFLVFKLISNRQSKLCGGSLFDYASMYLISEGCRCRCRCRSHRINVGSFQRLLEIQMYVTSICSSLPSPITLHLSISFLFVRSCSFALHLYSLECISCLMKYDRYDRVGRWFSILSSLSPISVFSSLTPSLRRTQTIKI